MSDTAPPTANDATVAAPATPTEKIAADTDNAAKIHRLKRLAAILSVLVASTLIVAKTLAYFSTESVSILSSLVDSLLDLAASSINLLAIRQAAQPADREHRFGHGKAEPLAGMGQSAFIAGSAVFLIVESGKRLAHPNEVTNEVLGVAVMLLSIVLTLALVLFQRSVVRRTQSVAIGADSLHYFSDLLVNSGVIVALILSTQLGFTLADPLFAMGIAIYILWSAWLIFSDSMNLLMDRELPEADRQRIHDIVMAHDSVISVHDLRTRSSGTQLFIQFHLELDGKLSLFAAHEIADAVMHDVEKAFPSAEVLIHEDPHGVAERRASFD